MQKTDQKTEKTATPRVLFIVTSNDKLGTTDKLTGFDLPECAHAYNELAREGFDIVFASPLGGKAPMDPQSVEREKNDQGVVQFLANKAAMDQINNTKGLHLIDISEFHGIFFPGGHGPMFDLPQNVHVQKFVRAIYESGGTIGAVCHGPCALTNVTLSNGHYLLNGHKVTGFSNAEEKSMKMDQAMPFLLEDKLKSRGAMFSAAEPMAAHIVVGPRLITGQNPASSAGTAAAMITPIRSYISKITLKGEGKPVLGLTSSGSSQGQVHEFHTHVHAQ